MKKLLMVLCAAAFGIGTVAQAQVVRADGGKRMEAKDVSIKMPVEMPDFSVWPQGQLQAAEARFDTLHWHDEYVTEECDMYMTVIEFMDDIFSPDVTVSPMGASYAGTGEVGTTYQTSNNLYDTYAQLKVGNAWVVGAIAYVYRRGNPAVWERVGTDRFDPEHMSEYNGYVVPDVPCRLIGYPGNIVEEQDAYANYYYMLRNESEDMIRMEMPVTMQGRVQSDVQYIRYLEPFESGFPGAHKIGGMFDHVFPASENFGVSVQAELTDNKTYDSLYNWAVTAKTNKWCSFIDDWATWERWDFSNWDSGWVWLTLTDKALDVSLPWNSEDSVAWGFAPDNCPQHDNGQGLYVYAFSGNMLLSDGFHCLPMIYPIIQDRTSIERNQDAYAQTVSVYPLPATDKVDIVALDEIQKVEIYNMAGTLLKVIKMNDIHLELDVTSFAPGTYVAKITTGKGVASKKLLVR